MKRTKNELLQSCIEQFEHIDSVNNNLSLNTTESLIMEIKEAINYTQCCTELSEKEPTLVYNGRDMFGKEIWLNKDKI